MQCMNMCLLCSPWGSKPSKRRCWDEELAEQIPSVFSRLHRFSPPHELQLRQGHNDALGGALCWRRHIAVQRIHSHHAVLGLVVLEYEASRGKWGKHDKSNKKSKKNLLCLASPLLESARACSLDISWTMLWGSWGLVQLYQRLQVHFGIVS